MVGAHPTEPEQEYVLETLPTNTPDQFSFRNATFDEVLEELSSRFILNLPEEELAEVERVCFQIEQAHWYYEDFIREENPSLPSYSLKKFSEILFHACPLLHHWSHDHETAFNDFMEYKTRVPVCGAVMLNDALTKCILVKGWKASAGWSFPRGKVNENEDEALCAAREVLEETGYNLNGQIQRELCIKLHVKHQPVTLFVVPGVPEDFEFRTQTRKEISKIDWFKLSELPGWKKTPVNSNHKFYLIHPVIGQLKAIVRALRKARKTERSAPEALQINGTSSYPPTSDTRHLAQAKLSSESLVADHCQIGSTETEMSSSQSSSADPHTPSVHGDLSPHTFGETFTMKNLFTVDSEGRPLQHVTEMHLDRVSPVNVDAQNHLSLLMSKLTESESSLTPQAATPTPVISEPSIEASPSPSSVNVPESHGPPSSSSLSTVCPAPASVASPQPPPPAVAPAISPEADLIKRTRQLQLLDSVIAEQSTKVAPAPPHTAHLFGNFSPPPPVNGTPNTFPIRSASVRPTVPIPQYTQPPYHPPPSHIPVVPNHSKVLPPPSPHILQHQPFIRSPPVVPHSIMNGPNVPVPRPSTALSSQMYMASNLPRNLAHIGGATIDPGHRGQMLAILSGNSPQLGPKSPSAGYMGHRATSSLAMPAQRNGNARLLSILNEGRGPMAR